MSDYFGEPTYSTGQSPAAAPKDKDNYFLHLLLFVLTFITTTIAGAEWISGYLGTYEFTYLMEGLPYSLSILFIIGCHEFGHYFAAKAHKVKATLPYFIPFPSIAGFLNFGTLGAVIKTKSQVPSNKAMFDIGVAGPIAGFIASLVVLIYGFTHLPDINYLLNIHPDYFTPEYGKTGLQLEFGDTLLFALLREAFTSSGDFIPPMSEIYHYPFLCVGWFGLFVTAMNMIPVGQLDGGHISYTLFGEKRHFKISGISFLILFLLGIMGIIENVLELQFTFGWSGWLFWAIILYFVIKLKHPPVEDNIELSPLRKFLGYTSFLIFVVSFSPTPFIVSLGM